MPAEFEPVDQSYMIWPQRSDNWRNGGKPAQHAFSKLAEMIAKFQPLTMLVNQSQYQNARRSLSKKIRVVEMSSNDAWIKDVGPFYITNRKEIRGIDFEFNAWGGLVDGLYFPWDKDNQISQKILDLSETNYYRSGMVLEGCAVMVDGEGTLITTDDVILSEGRNKGMTKDHAENIFAHYFGIKKTIWLKQGYFMDETGGDIDNMINFVRPGEIVLTWTDDINDPQYKISHEAYETLLSQTDAAGRKFIIHKIQTPRIIKLTEEEANQVDMINGMLPRFVGQRLTATYVNYLTINNIIIMPIFDDPEDKKAKRLLQNLYPKFEVHTINAREFLNGGGGIHTVVSSVPTIIGGGKK
ncbi:aguA2 protein [Pediococcus claussenii]|nr:aguA2 protein [Pediococcus claussenii]